MKMTSMQQLKTIGMIAALSVALTGCIVPGNGGETEPWGTVEPGNNGTANNQQANNQSTNNTSNTSSSNNGSSNTTTTSNNQSTNNTSANNTSANNNSSSNTTTVEPSERTVLRGTYIAGHLGSYWDCPGEGYTGEDAMMSDGARGDGLIVEGDCAEDSCGFLNCQDAQMTVLLSNDGQLVAEEIAVAKIRLLDLDDRELGVLPLIGVQDADKDEVFDGTLAVGQQIRLRVDFLGPENLQKLKDDAASDDSGISNDGDRLAKSGALIEITFVSKNADDEIVVSKEIYDLPAVDT